MTGTPILQSNPTLTWGEPEPKPDADFVPVPEPVATDVISEREAKLIEDMARDPRQTVAD